MYILPENIPLEIKEIRQEVKQFVIDDYSYYGITYRGFLIGNSFDYT